MCTGSMSFFVYFYFMNKRFQNNSLEEPSLTPSRPVKFSFKNKKKTFNLITGFVGSLCLHQEWQGPSLSPVCWDVEGQDRRSLGGLSEVDAQWRPAAHLRRDRLCPIRLPANGEALHVTYHHKDVEHSGRFGNVKAFREVRFFVSSVPLDHDIVRPFDILISMKSRKLKLPFILYTSETR